LARNPEVPPEPPSSFAEFIQLETLNVAKDELAFKRREAQLSRFFNPLLVAIIGAILVGLGNVGVSYINARSAEAIAEQNAKVQTDMTQAQIYNSTAQENMKAENSSVLEVIKLNDPDKVRNGLCLLLKLNSIKTDNTNLAVRGYVKEHNGCDEPKPPEAQWQTASATVPGCGFSGCYQGTLVCGPVPSGMKPTGNTRNFIDSFSGAWGDWEGAPSFGSDKVCRVFSQHSHNVTRAVSFQYEVVPSK
jgi:hypothetical protein